LNALARRSYSRKVATARWRVTSITLNTSAPSSSALVTKPERSECPENRVGSTLAALAQRLTISATDCPVKRDKALILIGFAAALRRSELVALTLADVERAPDGIVLHIRRSKSDQDGQGDQIAVPNGRKLKPVEALDAWLEAAAITQGPIFRRVIKGGRLGNRLTTQSVALIVKRWAKAARVDSDSFSGHSLRAGFVTSALADGADLFKVMDVTRHREVKTLKAYDRRAKAFKDHAGKGFL
jgi:site-specific recombinase XerD